MIRIYGMAVSGNCYKVLLLLSQLGLEFEWVEIDVIGGETRAEPFLRINPNGKTPVLEIEPGVYLAESNAILCYLAEHSPYWPADRVDRARVLQWLFFEQYSHEPYVAVARFMLFYMKQPGHPELAEKQRRGHLALGVMEQHLSKEKFFVGGRYSIADIALYAYTHVADEGGFDLAPYPAIRAWLARVEFQRAYVPMNP